MPQDKFASYFDHCFNILNDKKVLELSQCVLVVHVHLLHKDIMNGELPGYFRFITIMALYAFLEEKVIISKSHY